MSKLKKIALIVSLSLGMTIMSSSANAYWHNGYRHDNGRVYRSVNVRTGNGYYYRNGHRRVCVGAHWYRRTWVPAHCYYR